MTPGCEWPIRLVAGMSVLIGLENDRVWLYDAKTGERILDHSETVLGKLAAETKAKEDAKARAKAEAKAKKEAKARVKAEAKAKDAEAKAKEEAERNAALEERLRELEARFVGKGEQSKPGRTHMPLLDHFHPPLSRQRQWESFHGAWAEAIAKQLNEDLLPPRYFAEARAKVGRRVEVDVSTLEDRNGTYGAEPSSAGGVALWAPPRPAATTPLAFSHPDLFEIQVWNDEEDRLTRGGHRTD